MRLPTPFLLASLTTLQLAAADFLISNTSVCMGTFFVSQCYHGAKVLSDASDINKTYTCPNLVPAEDDHYIHNGTAGPFGSDNLISDGGICDSGKLFFEKTGAGNESGYSVKDQEGKPVAECEWDYSGAQKQCNQWVGMLYFASMYRCKGNICG